MTNFLLEGKMPARVALCLVDSDHNYGELQDAVNDVAAYLVEIGGRKGDRVILVGENSFFWVAAYLGILRSGLVCVPLPVSLTASDVGHVLALTEPRVAFLQANFAVTRATHFRNFHVVTDREVSCQPPMRSLRTFADLRDHARSSQPSLPEVNPDDLAALMFTSGSTGKPRGVMVSHSNIIANTESIIQYLDLTENDRIMTVLPFHYCFGTSLLHTHLHVGGSLVVDPRFMYPEIILQRMLDTECTGFAGVPSHFQILLRKAGLARRQFPHLRYVQQAGGHLAPSFLRELRQALPRTQIFVMYGQTEATARLSYVPPEHLDRKMGSIGKAAPGVKLQVLDESGEGVEPGRIGEIVAEGANVTLGYWREPEESAKCFRRGKLYTGDLGTVDDEGFIYVVDRAKDFLKCGGKRISCQQLEEKLLEFDELLEAALIGVSHDMLGEAVKAFVVPRNPHSDGLKERVLQFCKKHLAHQLVPKDIVVMNALPKNSAGKVLKQRLRIPEA